MPQETQPAGRRHRELAQQLMADIASGIHQVGGRLPGERDLAQQYGISRGTVREAVIVLEVMGIVEVRKGSGAHILPSGQGQGAASPKLSAFEIAEALLMVQGDAAALAAREIGAREVDEIEDLIRLLNSRSLGCGQVGAVEREFHLAIAKASRNQAVYEMLTRLWELCNSTSETASLRSPTSGIESLVSQYTAVLDALRRADPDAARTAMSAHLTAVLDGLLFGAEEVAVSQIRLTTEAQRSRYMSGRN